MARTLVLVRHGKAESAREGVADINRSLTPEGMRALEEAFPQVFGLLKASGLAGAEPVALWSSPALRARHTTERVIGGLKAAGVATGSIELHESLWHQDAEAFVEELAGASGEGCIVAVGHIPFMENMLERLSGNSISIKPGGVAALSLTGSLYENTPARLEWFIQGPKAR